MNKILYHINDIWYNIILSSIVNFCMKNNKKEIDKQLMIHVLSKNPIKIQIEDDIFGTTLGHMVVETFDESHIKGFISGLISSNVIVIERSKYIKITDDIWCPSAYTLISLEEELARRMSEEISSEIDKAILKSIIQASA